MELSCNGFENYLWNYGYCRIFVVVVDWVNIYFIYNKVIVVIDLFNRLYILLI